jgi:superfamily II DNA or RNA helicase
VNVVSFSELTARRLAEPTPQLTLRVEPVLVNEGDPFEPEFHEVEVPVLELGFRYGNVVLGSNDDRERLFVSIDGELQPVDRNRAAEARAKRLLEGLGAVELGCLDSYEPGFGSTADYVVSVDDDVNGYCMFGAYAIPQLKSLGWQVEVAADYPYRVVEGTGSWFASLIPADEDPDWFSLELGVEIEGRRTSLLPALVEMLESCPDLTSLESLIRRARRGVALPAGDGRYVVVPGERLRGILLVLRELCDGSGAPRELPSLGAGDGLPLYRGQAPTIAHLDAVFAGSPDALAWEGATEVREEGEALVAHLGNRSLPIAHGLRATLRSYQVQGVSWMQSLRALDVGGVLADDMGLGKTLQTIAHLLTEKEQGRRDRPSLVVAPTSLVGNWRRELSRFAPQLRVVVLHGAKRKQVVDRIISADVVLTTYPVVVRDEDLLTSRPWHLLVLDEAQAIKNPRSLAHRTVRQLDARHRLCLTGTPIENNLGELWALFDFLMPGMLGNHETFKTRFRHPIEVEGNEDRLQLLRQRVGPFILRRMKSEVVQELPPKTELVRPVELDHAQRELYESIRIAAHTEVRKVIRNKGLAASTVPVLDALMKLRQVCCDPRLVPVEAARKVKDSAKLNALLELIDQQVAENRGVLVFSQFTSMLALIAEQLKVRAIDHVSLTGSTADRQQPVDRFQRGEADVFLISLKAGGTGLNLTRAETVIHYDPWWNPAAQAQATDRAYRIGQKNPVFVYNLIVAGSVEERMLALQERKRQLASGILAGGPRSTKLELADVENLFAPLE